jgi:hypothetical protein
MSPDKIKVSLDDVFNSRIDDKLKSQDAIARAQQHYQQQMTAAQQVSAVKAAVSGRTSIWYNSLFYMAVFGFLGGLVTWGASEIIQQTAITPLEEFRQCLIEAAQIEIAARDGDISMGRAKAMMDSLETRYADNPYVRILNDSTMSEGQRENAMDKHRKKDERAMFVQQMMWMGVIGICVALFLSVAEPVVSRNWRAVGINAAVGVFLGVAGGIIVSLFINQLYNAMGGGQEDSSMGKQMLARSIGWGILGLFLAIAPGIVMRSWKRLLIGLAGGFLGGLLGGLLFDPISKVTESGILSRAVALTGIGLVAALGTGLIERAAKTGWLKVVAGLIVGKQFILYRNPTNIGSSPQCEIYLFKDTQVAPRQAAIHVASGGCELESVSPDSATFVNGQAVSRKRLRNGDRIQIGSTVFEFQEKEKR